MPSITPVISAIFLLLWLISAIARTALLTTSPPCSAWLRALAQFGIALHNLTRRIRDIARRLPNLPDDLPQLLAHALHGLQQATGFIPCRHHDVVVEFTSGNAFRDPHR